MTNLPEI